MRALAGLFLLAVLAVAGLGSYTGQLPFAGLVARGLAAIESKGAAAATEKSPVEPAVASPRPIRIITQTIAVGEPPEAPAPGAPLFAAAAPLVAPVAKPVAAAAAAASPAKVGKAASHPIAKKHVGDKLACAAGQHLDHIRHKCIGSKHPSTAQMTKPLG